MKEPHISPPVLSGDVILLPDFPVYKQQTDHTCGPATVRMILEYLGLRVTEPHLAARCATHPLGTLHWTLRVGFDQFLRKIGYTVKMEGASPDVYEHIKDSLKENLPVMFIYAVEDHFHPGKKVTHYGALIGVDEPARTVTFANPFGYIESMGIEEWWDRFSLSQEYMPADQQFAMRIGALKPRTVFWIRKCL